MNVCEYMNLGEFHIDQDEVPRSSSPTPSTVPASSASARDEIRSHSPRKPRGHSPKKMTTRSKRLPVRRSSPALRSQTSFMSMPAVEPVTADYEDEDEMDGHVTAICFSCPV